MASVRVIVPCYNYARYLPACVGSVLSQPGVEVSVLILNDASTDDSRSVADRLAAADGRIEVIHHETNQGHIATYNEGLATTRSDYVVLLSADDLLAPGALERAATLMDARPSVGLVYGHPVVFRGDGAPPPTRSGRRTWTVWRGVDWLERMCRAGSNFIYCPEVVMRTSVQHRIGYYNPRLPHTGDMEMWMRAAAVSDIGRINGVDQAFYRIHGASMQRTVHSGLLLDLKAQLDAFDSVLASSDLPEAERLLRTARRSIAVVAFHQAQRAVASGALTENGISACQEFAAALDRGTVPEAKWRALRRRLNARSFSPALALARVRESIAGRLRWRYWRWRGLEWPATPRLD
ncbi:MAG: hypothetical protein JWQ89_1917 [Devosia sp.]|uniref:glycosyltransferase family 2 protein n=1 Tax=Devosia sp. TaxID=1871048 RepID=UPI002630DBDE|nr:glycosyltransferase family 2 protein [Devosia sp.]MDB5540190.1 hypothetical protein [Devosia sp.]